MNYSENILERNYVKSASYERLKPFIEAGNRDILTGISLYRENINFSSSCLKYISIFEVALRNEIDRFYSEKNANKNWISLFPIELIKNSNLKKIDKMTLGFWVHLFAPKQFRQGGQCLHKIYVHRPKGTSPRLIFNELLFILNFRNRISHHESICFNKKREFSTESIQKFEEIILRHLVWLDYDIPSLIYFKQIGKTKYKN